VAGNSERIGATFDALFEATNRQVLAYAMRRTRSAADAEDIVAETFTVAWRRIADVPPDPLPWLYGVARRLIANQRRGAGRRLLLHLKLWSEPRGGAGQLRMEGGPATEALGRLSDTDQELLRLVAWESLDHAGIGQVLGISVNAVAIRLHRARARFAQELEKISTNDTKGLAPTRTSDQVTGRTTAKDPGKDAR
jgi:RNA polymerase sigma-70 factor (ECF subfamily)